MNYKGLNILVGNIVGVDFKGKEDNRKLIDVIVLRILSLVGLGIIKVKWFYFKYWCVYWIRCFFLSIF